MSVLNREQWLEKATETLRKSLFKSAGAEIPTVRVTNGFPGSRAKSGRVGEFWKGEASDDGIPQVFVSPVLSDSNAVLAVLSHELVHACVPLDGHGREFRRIALSIGLVGKMTATKAGPDLVAFFNKVIDRIGVYPHSALNVSSRKVQSTRLLKVCCASCGYVVRITTRWISTGLPLCPCSHSPMVVAS